jgi:acetylornithine aminotransferase/acetylornithine/N-succinyldiaminopimelate aminotransferase
MSKTSELYALHLLSNYAPPAITLVRGEGARVFDDTGKSYLDFCSGIATNALGHAHPRWVAAVQAQAATLAHASNLFRNEPQARLAAKLVQKAAPAAGPGRAFFCNSGTEANEALLKLSRLHGLRKSAGIEGAAYKVAVAANAFHGRTFGAMSATPQEKIQKGFRPLLDGVVVGELNNLESFARIVDASTAAVLVEAIQGEGGLTPATPDFLHGLRALCDKHNALLLFDEIQCGTGRTGKLFGFEHSGVRPDAFSLAKGLGGGFPIGAIWVADRHAALFQPGSHGTTFGGNPLACAAALAVLDTIEADNLLDRINTQSAAWRHELRAVVTKHRSKANEVRGIGYLTGIALNNIEAPAAVAALRDAGLLVVPAGGNVIRLLPPLNATMDELSESAAILDETFAGL